jgi:hypothetical protein
MAELLEIAKKPAGDGMPIGHFQTPKIAASQVTVSPGGVEEAAFDDNAMATIIWEDFQRDSTWLEQESWLSNWQYTQYWYQSPNFDRDWQKAGTTARISRFNIAKNTNTMKTQIRRGIFAGQSPFLLEAQGKMAEDEDSETYIDAWTELMNVLDQRADFEYQLGLLIHTQCLQGTGIGVPGWEEKTVMKYGRKPRVQPVQIAQPVGPPVTVHTWESDDWEDDDREETESWPYFEYRKLGMTMWDESCDTPNRPDKSAKHRIDTSYVTMRDLQQMRRLECYDNIPDDDELLRYFLEDSDSDGESPTNTALQMSQTMSGLTGASGEWKNVSSNPTLKPVLKLAYWTPERVGELLCFKGRKLIIRNQKHRMGDYVMGMTANWWDIDGTLYGIGIGRLNVGDQRMEQGMLNEVLKMIAYWTNAPLLYNSAEGNEPTQNVVMGLGTMWGLNAGPGTDIRKVIGYAEKPPIPKESWEVMDKALHGGEDLVGANSSAMQGNISSTQGMSRTAAGVNRSASQSDATVADPIANLEGIIVRWNRFKQHMVRTVMPIGEIRSILSKKFGDAIVQSIDPKKFLDMEFNVKVLAGQKLMAKAAISQLIPFLLQLLQQPQLMEYMHQKGWTINFLAIEKIFLRVSELQGAEDIIVPLSDDEKQQVQQNNPKLQSMKAAAMLEQLRQQGKLAVVGKQGENEVQREVVRASLEHVVGAVPLEQQQPAQPNPAEGPNPLELAEGRLTRNTDMSELSGGVGQE